MMNIAKFRSDMADAINRVAYGSERIILERRGKPAAALVSVDDVELLEAIENEHWVREARKALAEMKRKGEKPIAWKTAKQELDG